jgi:penicillin-binding protein 1A
MGRESGTAAKSRSTAPRRALRLGGPALVALVVGGLSGIGFAAIIDMPRIDSLSDFTPGLITQVHDASGEVFATFARERRFLLREGEVPEVIQHAVLAAEDRNFLRHGGVDAEGVVRALVRNLVQGRRFMGGSTITMQLARKLFLNPEKLWRRKIEEALLAVELEKNFSKEQILTLYCNLMFLGHGNYGMEAASRSYFGKPAAELRPAEAATLVGILQRPSDYSPYRRPDLVRNRRDYVLRRMLEEAYLSDDEYQQAVAEPLEVVTRSPKSARMAPYFAEEVRKAVEDQLGTAALLEQGLMVRTTLDPDIQRAAEKALRTGLVLLDRQNSGWRGPIRTLEADSVESAELESWIHLDLDPGAWNQGLVVSSDNRSAQIRLGSQLYELDPEGIRWTGETRPRNVLSRGDVAWFSFTEPADDRPVRLELQQVPELEGALIVLESATGAVRAMVGGWDFERSKFNRATQAHRQVGSAFKPFVYGAALEAGYTAADTFFDAPAAFPGEENLLTYSPRNYYRKYYGITTMRRALEKSLNVTAVKVMDLVGIERTIDFARRAGIKSELFPYPSLALGTADLTPLELAAAFAAIANSGLHVEPYFIEQVRDPRGNVLESHQMQARKAMEPEIAYVLTHILEGVIDQGTATDARKLELDLAGKTGTTDDYSDAWFGGFNPQYTMLVWVGHDVKRPIGRNMTGAVAALPIWISLIEYGLAEGWLQAGETFVPPPGVSLQQVEYNTGLLAAPGAERTINEAFIDGTEPALTYDTKWARILNLPWYQQRIHYLPKGGERMPEDVEDWSAIQERWEE